MSFDSCFDMFGDIRRQKEDETSGSDVLDTV